MEDNSLLNSLLPALSLVVLALTAFGIILFQRKRRSSHDVLEELRDLPQEELSYREDSQERLPTLNSEQVQYGIFSGSEWGRITRTATLFPLMGAAAVLGMRVVAAPFDFFGHVVLSGGGAALGYLAHRRYLVKKRISFRRQIDFYLPLVIERLAMAAQAGLDVLPAIKSVVEISYTTEPEIEGKPFADEAKDPVTIAFRYVVQLSESGLPLERAFREVSERFDSIPLRHALIHLAVAHEQGGALTTPLRELGDATQLYFQESVEEQIAKMPVRATLPLLLAFAGLILIFLSVPATQIIGVSSEE